MTASAQERPAKGSQAVSAGGDKATGQEGHQAGRIAVFWTAHLDRPISAADVPVMLRLAELAMRENTA